MEILYSAYFLHIRAYIYIGSYCANQLADVETTEKYISSSYSQRASKYLQHCELERSLSIYEYCVHPAIELCVEISKLKIAQSQHNNVEMIEIFSIALEFNNRFANYTSTYTYILLFSTLFL